MRMKVLSHQTNSYNFFSKVISEEGILGITKGVSACFYGSMISGFVYFGMYKWLKERMHKKLDGYLHSSMIYFSASFIAEVITLVMYYPYDLVK